MVRRLTTPAKIEEIKRLRSQGLTIDAIVAITNCSTSTIYAYTGAAERGFSSRRDYERFLNEERQKRKNNIELSDLIKERLQIMRRSKYWLAGKLGISKSAVTLYANGKRIPREDIYKRLLNILGLPYISFNELHKWRLASNLEDSEYFSRRFLVPQ